MNNNSNTTINTSGTSNGSSSSSSTSSSKSSASASAAGSNGSILLNNGESQTQAQLQTQLLECLEKLDLVIANQQRLEQQLAALGILEASNTVARAALNV